MGPNQRPWSILVKWPTRHVFIHARPKVTLHAMQDRVQEEDARRRSQPQTNTKPNIRIWLSNYPKERRNSKQYLRSTFFINNHYSFIRDSQPSPTLKPFLTLTFFLLSKICIGAYVTSTTLVYNMFYFLQTNGTTFFSASNNFIISHIKFRCAYSFKNFDINI